MCYNSNAIKLICNFLTLMPIKSTQLSKAIQNKEDTDLWYVNFKSNNIN